MKKILIMVYLLASSLLASDIAKLVEDNCISCHMSTKPTREQRIVMKAPPMSGVMYRLKNLLKDEKRVKEFIIDYIQNPTKEKALLKERKIARFGLMPSMKGVFTKEELDSIVNYLYDNFPSANVLHYKKKMIDKMKNPPFLIIGKMPHLAKIVKENWDNPILLLTDIQKKKLLEVRKITMRSVVKLKQKISSYEQDVAMETMSGINPKNLKIKVDQIAKLKVEATMVHIRCIYDTQNILDLKQLTYLLAQ